MRLTAYRVRELDPESATAAKVAVHIDYSNGQSDWTAAAVSTNILDASLRALVDGYEFFLWRQRAGGGSRFRINQTGKDLHSNRKKDSFTRT